METFITTAITANERKFSSSAQRLAYERGLLTGLITSLIDSDTYVDFVIKKKLMHLQINCINRKNSCFLPAAVIILHQAPGTPSTITHSFHPLRDQGKLSYCQRRLG